MVIEAAGKGEMCVERREREEDRDQDPAWGPPTLQRGRGLSGRAGENPEKLERMPRTESFKKMRDDRWL